MKRWEGFLLTAAQSRALIDQVDRWCERTGTNYNKLVVMAEVNPSTRSSVRSRGRCLTILVAARLEQVMRNNPHGISREAYREVAKPWDCPAMPEPPTAPFQIMRAVRETCGRCGSRVGCCEHTLSAAGGELRKAG